MVAVAGFGSLGSHAGVAARAVREHEISCVTEDRPL